MGSDACSFGIGFGGGRDSFQGGRDPVLALHGLLLGVGHRACSSSGVVACSASHDGVDSAGGRQDERQRRLEDDERRLDVDCTEAAELDGELAGACGEVR